MSVTAGTDGITTLDTVAPYPIPIATLRTGLTADAAASVQANSPLTSATSERRARRVVPAGCKAALARTVPADAAVRASYLRILVWATGPERAAAPASFPRIEVRTVQVPDAPVQSVRRIGLLPEASGADGADPELPRVTGEGHSEEAAPGKPVSLATVERAAWAAEAAFVGAAVAVAADAGDNPFPECV